MTDADPVLASLSQHPAWPRLRDRAEQMMGREFDRLTRAKMAGKDVPETQWAYTRGLFAGMKALLDSPALDAATLSKEGER